MAALSSLNRENILELVGYSATYDFETVALVTPYMANGNLANYMDTEVDMRGKLGLVSRTRVECRAGEGLGSLMSMFIPLWSVGSRHHEWFTIPACRGAPGCPRVYHPGTPPTTLFSADPSSDTLNSLTC